MRTKEEVKDTVESLTQKADECFERASEQHEIADKQIAIADEQHAIADTLATLGQTLEADAIKLTGEMAIEAARHGHSAPTRPDHPKAAGPSAKTR